MRLVQELLFCGPLLVGAGCATVPVCTAEQALSTDDNGTLVCIPAPQAVLAQPCSGMLTSDGKQLSCTGGDELTDPDTLAKLAQLTATATAQQQLLLMQKPPPKQARYVGVTTATPTGGMYIPMSSNGVGLTGAAALCAAQFGAGAHMCIMDELYRSAVTGSLASTATIPKSWVYVPSWGRPFADYQTAEPLAGLSDNCCGYTYSGTDRHWLGTLVEWSPLPSGDPGFRWHGSEALCTSHYPIACCK